jgi:hypothetical protein
MSIARITISLVIALVKNQVKEDCS